MRALASALEIAARIIRENADNPERARDLLEERIEQAERYDDGRNSYHSAFVAGLNSARRALTTTVIIGAIS